jgi:hypothetical protein
MNPGTLKLNKDHKVQVSDTPKGVLWTTEADNYSVAGFIKNYFISMQTQHLLQTEFLFF